MLEDDIDELEQMEFDSYNIEDDIDDNFTELDFDH